MRPSRSILHALLLAAVSLTLLGGCQKGTADSEPIVIPPYNATGTLDTNFGGGAVPLIASTGGTDDDEALALAIRGDNTIVATGYGNTAAENEDLAIWSVTPAGLYSGDFSGGNPLLTNTGSATAQYANAMVLGANNSILVAGFSDANGGDMTAWKFLSSGLDDATFNGALELFQIDTGGLTNRDEAWGVATLSSGDYVMAGSTEPGDLDMVVWVMKEDGSGLQTTFNASGTQGYLQITNASGDDEGYAVAVDGSGRIVVAGISNYSGDDEMTVWRVLADGSGLDTTFGTSGRFTDVNTGVDAAFAVTMDGNGKIVAAGVRTVGGVAKLAVWRLNANGILDTTFGTDGRYVSGGFAGGTGPDLALGLAIDAYGRILVTGSSTNADAAPNLDMVLLRLNTAGALDGTFNGTGFATYDGADELDDQGNAVAIDASGRIVVAGFSNTTTDQNGMLWRYK